MSAYPTEDEMISKVQQLNEQIYQIDQLVYEMEQAIENLLEKRNILDAKMHHILQEIKILGMLRRERPDLFRNNKEITNASTKTKEK